MLRQWNGRITTATPIWYPSAEMDSQLSHAGWGAFIMLAIALHLGVWWAGGILVVWALAKEYIFDIVIEKDPLGWPGSTEDAFFYIVGGVIGGVVWSLPWSL
jgi:hypothetical protein